MRHDYGFVPLMAGKPAPHPRPQCLTFKDMIDIYGSHIYSVFLLSFANISHIAFLILSSCTNLSKSNPLPLPFGTLFKSYTLNVPHLSTSY
jgi:hypothetical protein